MRPRAFGKIWWYADDREGGLRGCSPSYLRSGVRPKDRKKQILEQAVRLFIERGFHSVKLEEIAEAAGVTARALYRHYENKQALLAAAILTAQDEYQNARGPGDHGPNRRFRRFASSCPNLIAAAVVTRALTVLWQREARYLNDIDRAEVRRRINAIVAGMDESVSGCEIPRLEPSHNRSCAPGRCPAP